MSTSATVRRSQRPVNSCTECSRRKVRCSKNIPCTSCRARGIADLCCRETVRVETARPAVSSNEHPSSASAPISGGLLNNERASSVEMAATSAESAMRSPSPRLAAENDARVSTTVCAGSCPLDDNGASRTVTLPSPITDTLTTLEFLTHGRRSITSTVCYSTPSARDAIEARPWDLVIQPGEAKELLDLHQRHLCWMHNVVHMPTFRMQFEANIDTMRCEGTWQALYYALLSVSKSNPYSEM